MSEIIRCTGIAASWCPICGDCICPRNEDGDYESMDEPDCPIHGRASIHPDGVIGDRLQEAIEFLYEAGAA